MPKSIPQPEKMIVAPHSPEHTRNGEADMIRLKDDSLLLAYGRWSGCGGDFDYAEIAGKVSNDGGRTWGGDRVIVPNEGGITTFSTSLLRLRNGEILMSYCVKDQPEECSIYFRKSNDECRTWGPRVKFELGDGYAGYTAMNNNRLIQLADGRILGAAWDGYFKGLVIVGFAVISDDDGVTWRKSGNDVDIRVLDPSNRNGAQEPNVVELNDGRIMMLIRNDLGCIARAYSTDQGETWGKPELVRELEAPLAPSSIARLPQTGDLLLIWNNNRAARRPLNSAISTDEGETWRNIRVVDDGEASSWGFAYTSITPADDRVLLTYWAGDAANLKLASIDYRWFYERD